MAVRNLIPLVIAAALFAAGSSLAADASADEIATEGCEMRIEFSNESAVAPWQIVNDGVMGGRSIGTRFYEDGSMSFRGIINTNGGGFSSLRRAMMPGDLDGAAGLRLKVRSDGRAYKLTFRTTERWRGRSISYQADIPVNSVADLAEGEWADVTVSFEDLETSIFGRRVQAAPFDPADVREMGIILADGIDGRFRMEVAEMSCISSG